MKNLSTLALTRPQAEYTLGILFNIAFDNISEFKIEYNRVLIDNFKIEFKLSLDSDMEKLLNGTYQLTYVNNLGKTTKNLPFMIDSNDKLIEEISDGIKINADILSLPFYLLSRKEVYALAGSDTTRFSYYQSLSYKYKIIDIPIVDEYALWLQQVILNRPIRAKKLYKQGLIIPTHDIDTARRFNGLLQSIISLWVGDLIVRKSMRCFIESLTFLIKSFNKPQKDPEILGIEKLLDLSHKYNLTSVFFFMGHDKLLSNYHYDVFMPSIRECINKIKAMNMLIGIHGDISTAIDARLLEQQCRNLKSAASISTVNYSRQHCLDFHILHTPSILSNLGVKEDFSLGFFDMDGFMCGTCHRYPLYDLIQDRALEVFERPLILMDCTLKSHRQLSKQEAYVRMELLYKKCMSVGGDFILLWHNAYVYRDYRNWYEEVYCRFIEKYA